MNLSRQLWLCLALSAITVIAHAQNSVVAWGGYWNGTKLFPGSANVTAIAGGNIALTSDGQALGWDKTVGPTNVWSTLSDGVQISAGRNHSMALSSSGTVLNSGTYSSGTGGKIAAFVPATLSNVVYIASGCDHDLALKSDGTISIWGAPGYVTPAAPAGLSNVVAIAAGCGQNLALRADGTLVTWGNPKLPMYPIPAGLNDVVAIAAKYYHFVALRRDGTVVAWGYNVYGESNVPQGLNNVVAIAAGEYHTLALKSDGTVVGWGHKNFGQTSAPAGATNIISVSAAFDVSLALMNDGSPVITVPPIGKNVTEGTDVSFKVLAVGAGGVNYQWRRDGDDIAGATDSALNFTAQLTNGGNYSVRISNAIGSVTSVDAPLVVTGNHAPVATPKNVTGQEDAPLAITLEGTDVDGDTLSYSIVTAPANGTLSGTPPNVTYRPNTNFNGADQFVFLVNDGKVDSAPAAVQIDVNPVNDAPTATPQSVSVNQGASVSITLAGDDIDGDALTFAIAAQPTHGTLSGVAPNITYHPTGAFVGHDQFTFRVRDGIVNSTVATMSITVLDVNQPPVAKIVVSPLSPIASFTNLVVISGNGTNATVVLNGKTSTDPEHDPLSFLWFDGTNVLANSSITTNTLDVGTHEIELQVTDGVSVSAATTELEIVSADSSLAALIAFVKASHLNPRNEQSLLASLYAAQSSLEKGNVATALSQLKDFQSKVRSQISPVFPVLAQKYLRDSQAIMDALRRS